jgi:multidrug resistance efflux pump
VAQAKAVEAALLGFEQRVRASASNREVAFCAVNESAEALRYDQAILWRMSLFSRPKVVAASGLADVAADSPYQQWLGRLIGAVLPKKFDSVRALAAADIPQDIAADGEEWIAAHMLMCPLNGPDGTPLGGVMFLRSSAFSEQERAAAEWIAQATAFGLWAWRRDRARLRRWLGSRGVRRIALGALALVVLAALIPVPLTALAPAEITSLKPIPVTSPMEGVVRQVLVKPNQQVSAGEVVAVLDDTAIRNKLAVAEKALDIARADLQRATYKSFSDDASRMELQVLESRVREKAAEVAYLSELLGRLKLAAPQSGIAVFTEAEDWHGKPVQIGERIMTIADPSLIDVTVYVAPEDAVELEPGARVVVFLHADPLSSLEAKITRSSYEAVPSPDGTLAYVVRAELRPGHKFPRVGLRGTAKVYAGRVSLAYYLFRKPLGYLRRAMGV